MQTIQLFFNFVYKKKSHKLKEIVVILLSEKNLEKQS